MVTKFHPKKAGKVRNARKIQSTESKKAKAKPRVGKTLVKLTKGKPHVGKARVKPRAGKAIKKKPSAGKALIKALKVKPRVGKTAVKLTKVKLRVGKTAVKRAKIKPVKGKLTSKKALKVEEAPKKIYPLKHLYSFVRGVAGTDGLKVVKSVGEGATDEVIGEKTELKVSEVRHLLNQLHNHGVVEYSREKNMTTGWFTYTWKFNMDRTMKNLLTAKAKKKEELLNALSEEKTTQFYSCRGDCARLCFEDAVDADFRCSCGKKLYYSDNAERVKGMKEELEAITAILELTPP